MLSLSLMDDEFFVLFLFHDTSAVEREFIPWHHLSVSINRMR
jgi:hypothetical protein